MAADILAKITAWLTSEPSNLPGNSYSVKKLADNLRQIQATVATFFGSRASIALAATVDLDTISASKVDITAGTGPLSSFGTVPVGFGYQIRAKVAFTLTRNATSLETITGADIAVVAGDQFDMESLGSGNWFMTSFQRADGSTVQPNSGATINRVTLTGNYTLVNGDKATAFDMTGTWTLTFAAMPAGWWVELRNAGTGDITVSGTIGSVSNPIIYPGEVRRVYADGSTALIQGGFKEYTANGTFTVPPGTLWVEATVIGSGAGGGGGNGFAATSSGGSGGGGGFRAKARFHKPTAGSMANVTVGAAPNGGAAGAGGGGSDGIVGNGSIFQLGTSVSAAGGGVGRGGILGGASPAVGTGATTGAPIGVDGSGGNGGTTGSVGASAVLGGGGGGGGGASTGSTAGGTGGSSLSDLDGAAAGGLGGTGGLAATAGAAGTFPGGGGAGGGSSSATGRAGGNGGAGCVRVRWG